MKVIIQRTKYGKVEIEGRAVAETGPGYVLLIGVRKGDNETDAKHLARKTVNLRIFHDDAGKMNRSIEDVQGEVLAISQFTLYANVRKGNRPSFVDAAAPEDARHIYNKYVAALKSTLGEARVKTGVFGANMSVTIINEGPVTIELTSEP